MSERRDMYRFLRTIHLCIELPSFLKIRNFQNKNKISHIHIMTESTQCSFISNNSNSFLQFCLFFSKIFFLFILDFFHIRKYDVMSVLSAFKIRQEDNRYQGMPNVPVFWNRRDTHENNTSCNKMRNILKGWRNYCS